MSLNILWVDDESNLLNAYKTFFEKKGYNIQFKLNAFEGIEFLKSNAVDIILLDENMPGKSGLESLNSIKEISPLTPVIMITKSEEEDIMFEAIGKYIDDYLIKPINPIQLFSSIKKVIEKNKLISNQSSNDFQRNFNSLNLEISYANSFEDWVILYKKIVNWELKLDNISEESILEIFNHLKEEANRNFGEYIHKNYLNIISNKDLSNEVENPILSHQSFNHFVKPHLSANEKVLLLVIDNLTYDKWILIQTLISNYYKLVKETICMSILPSVTNYARNSFFAGLTPLEIHKNYPDKWLFDYEEGNKNEFEKELLLNLLKKNKLEHLTFSYFKLLNSSFEQKLLNNFNSYKSNNLTVIVYNFFDIISHAKTDNRIIQDLIKDDKSFRSITYSFFKNSGILKIIEKAAENNIKLLVTTDHGSISVNKNIPIIADKETSSNIRYKTGKNLKFNSKNLFEIDEPEKYQLPKSNVSSKYIFAKEKYFFTYPKNQNEFVQFYKDSFQHGGISMDELLIPFTVFTPKK